MCAVKWFLGFPCPGCGLLHALAAALRGSWAEAFSFYPIWPLVLVFFLAFRRSARAGKFFVVSVMVQWLFRLMI